MVYVTLRRLHTHHFSPPVSHTERPFTLFARNRLIQTNAPIESHCLWSGCWIRFSGPTFVAPHPGRILNAVPVFPKASASSAAGATDDARLKAISANQTYTALLHPRLPCKHSRVPLRSQWEAFFVVVVPQILSSFPVFFSFFEVSSTEFLHSFLL